MKQALRALRELIAPARCINCLREDTWLCSPCRAQLPKLAPTCLHCGTSSPRGLICRDCRDQLALTGSISAGPYAHIAFKRSIGWLKFKGIKAVAGELASLLLPQLPMIAPIPELVDDAVFVPIPLHHRRERERGFNQSEVIAEALSRYTNIPVSNSLTRPKSTWTQSQLPHELRAQNLADAFAVNESVEPKSTYILIDDVTTTGATLDAAAHTLKQSLPSTTVWAATIARG